MYGVCFIWYKCSCYVSSGCFGGNIISLRWENLFPSFFANTFDNKGNSCCQILLIAIWIKARLLRENKKWIQTDLSSISWHSDRSMAPTCTRLKRLFQKKILWRTLQTHDADMFVIKIPQNSFLHFIFLKKMFYHMSQWVMWSVCLYMEMPSWWKMLMTSF